MEANAGASPAGATGERSSRWLSALDGWAARSVLRRLGAIDSGRLEIRTPDGTLHGFGKSGSSPAATIRVNDLRAFLRILLEGETGAGIAYVNGEWEAENLVSAIRVIIENRRALGGGTRLARLLGSLVHRMRRNTVHGSRRNIARHYDLGNEFFELFLDPTMTYSAAVFADDDDTLEAAQLHKYRRLAEKAGIRAEDHVLEIGCGWGGFAEFAAREIGCRVTGLTISRKQAEYAEARIRAAGLEDRVRIERTDYRHAVGSFDRIVSIEMLEAVGHENLATWFAACDRLLGPGGTAAVQVITIPDQRYAEYRRGSDFIRRYIFPGGHLPSLGAMARALESHSTLGIESIENIAAHYAETLRRWRNALVDRRRDVLDIGLGDEFFRRWEYYLAYCEAAFASRILSDLQIVLARPGSRALGTGPYRSSVA